METISQRIDFLISQLNITKTAFACKLKVTQPYISKLTNVGGIPSDRLIDDICEKYNVNENWLRHGTGEIFKELPSEDETAIYVSELLEDEDNPLYVIITGIMKTYIQLDPDAQQVIKDFSTNLLNNLKTKKEG